MCKRCLIKGQVHQYLCGESRKWIALAESRVMNIVLLETPESHQFQDQEVSQNVESEVRV